jgi:hypothetical protein
MATLLLLTSCAGTPKFPTEFLYEYDAKYQICAQYRVVDAENLKFAYVKDVPCMSIFGFSAADTPNVLNWARDRIRDGKERCR